jgi:hypothetical protein
MIRFGHLGLQTNNKKAFFAVNGSIIFSKFCFMFSDIYGWSKDLKFYNIDKCFVYILVGFYLSKQRSLFFWYVYNYVMVVFLCCGS